MATKTTKAELESRISQIYKLIIIGSSRQKILQYASKKWGELSDRTVDGYIASARKLMMQNLEIDRTVALAEELELRREIIFQAMQDKKYQIALQASDSRAKHSYRHFTDTVTLCKTTPFLVLGRGFVFGRLGG